MSVATYTNEAVERYDQAQREELFAREELASWGVRDEARFRAWENAQRELLDARGQVFAGRTYVQDSGPVDRGQWCSCTEPGEHVYYEAFDRCGQRASHGYVCNVCRNVSQVG